MKRVLSLVVPMAAAASIASGAPVDRHAERAKLFRADKEWAEAAAAHDLEKTLAFWTDDATVIPPGQPAVVGKDAIRSYVSQGFALPGFSISWVTTEFVVSASGDMAYGVGTNQVTLNDPQGNRVTEQGRAATVWRKGADGQWKCVVDIWNPAPSAPPAAK